MNVSRISKTVSVAVGTGIATLLNSRKARNAATKLERDPTLSAYREDMAKLAHWGGSSKQIKTAAGQLVAGRLEAFHAALKVANFKADRLQLELDAMRPLFAPMAIAGNSPAAAAAAELAPEAPPSGVIVGSYDTGLDKWVHGERNHEGQRFLGPCPVCGRRTTSNSINFQPNTWRCVAVGCEMFPLSVRLDPPWWNTDIAVVKDGNMWRANRASFVNLQESRCEFAGTPGAAVALLVAAEKNIGLGRLRT